MSEREQRGLPGSGEPAVPDVGAFRIVDGCRRSQLRARRLAEIGRKADRQPARWIRLPGKDFCDRPATLLPGIPRLHDRGHRVTPRHGHRVSGLQHHHCVRVGRGDRGDQPVLTPRQRQIGRVESFAFGPGGVHDRDVGPPCHRHRLGRADTGVEFDVRPRQQLPQFLQRARRLQVQIAHARFQTRAADWDHVGITARRKHGAGTESGRHAAVRVATDDGDTHAPPGRQRQRPAVLQQDDSLPCNLEGNVVVRVEVRLWHRSPLVDAHGEHRPQNPPHHVRQPLLGKPAVGIGGPQWGAERFVLPQQGVDLGAALLVETGQGALPARRATPVRHHPAGEFPGTLEHVVEQDGVRGGVVAVDFVVGGHHRAGPATFYRELEGQQVGFAVRVGVDQGVQPVPIGLVAVQREVLGRADDTVLLDSGDLFGGHGGAEQGILGEVLEIAAVTRIAGQVHRARQLHIESAATCLDPDHRARGAGQLRIESGRQCEPGRQRGGSVARPETGIGHAESGVTHPQRRDTQSRDPRHVPGAHRDLRRDPLIAQPPHVPGAHHAHQQGEALVVGQLFLDLARAGVRVFQRTPSFAYTTRSTWPSSGPITSSVSVHIVATKSGPCGGGTRHR